MIGPWSDARAAPVLYAVTMFDLLLAAVLGVESFRLSGGHGVLWWLLAVSMGAGLVLRRRLPLTAVLLTGAGALLMAAPVALDLAVPLAVYGLARGDRSRRFVTATFAVVLAGAVGLTLLGPQGPAAAPVPGLGPDVYLVTLVPPHRVELMLAALYQGAGLPLMIALGFALGRNARNRSLEQERRATLAAADERARITRELHDVVAHGLSVMVVQAQGAAAALHRHPDRCEAALQNVIVTGRSSLAEMRRLLAVARRDERDAELAPQPGVESLPELVDRIRAAGTPVAFVVEGVAVPLPAGVSLSAFRIVQEALTNTLKHAGSGASATVRLGYRPDALEVEVGDDGPPSLPSGEEGNGLRGIRERVGLLGGRLTIGPAGYHLLASIPLSPAAVG